MLLTMLHLAAFTALEPGGPGVRGADRRAGDLVLAALLGWLARPRRTTRSPKRRCASARTRCARSATAPPRAMVLAPLLRSQTAKKGLLGAAVTAVVVGLLSRR